MNKNAEEEVVALSPDLQARLIHIIELIQMFGPFHVGLPHVRNIGQKLWELRLKGKDNIARSLYVLASRKRLIILHTFVKKTQQTPSRALMIAELRQKEIKL